ncbi:MAG: hypothetical protein A2X46_07995 [Lentisphaerae bacterium GWF2_57_35]|nr:MAG: hypothetical protein A2X46_07995 [Lentisphaerae bacterium GWF2_57_35]
MRMESIISVLLSGLAGLCVFLFILNRYAILMRDSRYKTPLVLLLFVVIPGGLAWAGWVLPAAGWMGVPAGIILLCLMGECRRLWIRRQCKGSPPVDSIPHQVGLFRPFTTTDAVVHRYEISLPSWQGPAFRIVHLSDLHVNPKVPAEYFRNVLSVAEDAQADYAFMTGDFVTKAEALPELEQVLRPVARRSTFAVLGNHDYWAGADKVRSVIRNAGVTLLRNETLRLDLEGHEILLTGWDYPWGERPADFPDTKGQGLHLVLSHTPDNIYRLSRASVHGVFSGHYHAGQARIPWLGPVVIPSLYGRRFDHGHFVVHGTHLFVASGVGAANPPVRIYCQPDIFIVDITGYSTVGQGAAQPSKQGEHL